MLLITGKKFQALREELDTMAAGQHALAVSGQEIADHIRVIRTNSMFTYVYMAIGAIFIAILVRRSGGLFA